MADESAKAPAGTFVFGSGAAPPINPAFNADRPDNVASPNIHEDCQANYERLNRILDIFREDFDDYRLASKDSTARMERELARLKAAADDREKWITGLDAKIQGDEMTIKEQAAQLRSKDEEISTTLADVEEKELEISHLTDDIGSLNRQVTDLQTDLAQKSRDVEVARAEYDIQGKSIDKLHGDIKDLRVQLRAVKAEKEGAQSELFETNDKLGSLRAQWDAQEDELEELRQSLRELPDANKMISELEQEVEDLTKSIKAKSDEIIVKDTRIQSMESELQKLKTSDKSLDGRLKEMDDEVTTKDDRIRDLEAQLQKTMRTNLDTTGSVTAVPLSLEDELQEIGDDLDQDELGPEEPPQHLAEFYGVVAVIEPEAPDYPLLAPSPVYPSVETAPIDSSPQRLTRSSVIDVMSITPTPPVSPPTPQSVQPPAITTFDSPPLDSISPQLLRTRTAVIFDSPPSDSPASVATTAQAPIQQLGQSQVFTIIDQNDIRFPFSKALSKTASTISPWISLILLALCFYLYRALLAWQHSNTPAIGRHGAFGNGRHILGVIPVGYAVGESALSEHVARFGTIFIQSVEQWAGVDQGLYF
jgi:predicted  nucleic acid-binding Zn-ribbon protein